MSKPEPSPECQWAQAELFQTGGPADPTAARRLQVHLASCPDCRQMQAFDSRFAEMLTATPGPRTLSGMHDRVRVLLRRRRQMQIAAVSMAAAVFIGFASLAFWPFGGDKARRSPDVVERPPTVAPAAPLADLTTLLAAGPPVVPVTGDQAGWLAAINEDLKGRKP